MFCNIVFLFYLIIIIILKSSGHLYKNTSAHALPARHFDIIKSAFFDSYFCVNSCLNQVLEPVNVKLVIVFVNNPKQWIAALGLSNDILWFQHIYVNNYVSYQNNQSWIVSYLMMH